MFQMRPDFVLELAAPNGLAPGAVPEGVPRLHHKALDHAVENERIVISVLNMRDKVFHRSRAILGEQLDRHIAQIGRHQHVARE